ncbi:MAG TPA: ribosome small subunit-dependent GTPase A [Gemmatimonadaceae bacterium]|jgi:ribosome biogenesis GTPase|nr:ribosome small subunit-dependent GTPase A [Gemmatimonadaceae bacterium]
MTPGRDDESAQNAPRGIVLSGTGGVWRVRREDGSVVEASLRGRVKKSSSGRRADGSLRRDTISAAADTLKLTIGDHVLLEGDETSSVWAISEILPRRSRLARRAPGGGQGERVVAANVDQVVVVFAAANPEPHPRMLDRFLVIAEANGLAARIVINKVELVGGAEAARARWLDYERAGYPVHYTSVKRAEGLETLHAVLAGVVSVLTGPSGVGKSSLLNAMFPGLDLRVGEISESVNKGRHTTVGGYLHPLPGTEGGYVADTPGLREVGMWALSPTELDTCFPELRPFLHECRFADCRHSVEPDCAVRTAVTRGEVSKARYESFIKLRDELEASKPVSW